MSDKKIELPEGDWIDAESGGVIRKTERGKKFVEFFVTEAKWNPSEAARLAGYSHAKDVGAGLARKFKHVIDAVVLSMKDEMIITAEEAMKILAEIARDASHKDRLRAVELAMKVHGLLSDKLVISTDRKVLEKELDDVLTKLAEAKVSKELTLTN